MELSEFGVSLVFLVGSGTARAMQRDLVSKTKPLEEGEVLFFDS